MTEVVKQGRAGRMLVWIFAGVGLLAAVAVIWLVAMLIGTGRFDRSDDPAPVAVKGQTTPFSVQDVRDVRGTGLVQLAIGIPGKGGRVSYSSSSGHEFDLRNVILLDKATGVSRRLLADNRRGIVEFVFLPAVAETDGAELPADQYVDAAAEETSGKKLEPPSAYYVLAVQHVEGKGQDVLVGNIAGARQAFLLKNIDGIDRMWMLTPTRLAMVVREGMAVHYKVIDVPALKLVLARPVEIG